MSKDLEIILDECIEQVRQGRELAEVLGEFPKQADELRPLLELAAELELATAPALAQSGKAMALVKTMPTARNFRRSLGAWVKGFFSMPALSRAVATAFVFFFIAWGATVVSADSVSGDLLYPLKWFKERARFYLTINPEQKAELRIIFSAERLKEAVKKYERGEGLDEELLSTMMEEARLAIEESGKLSENEQRMIVNRAASINDYHQQVLSGIGNQVSEPVCAQDISCWVVRCIDRGQWVQEIMEDSPHAEGSNETPRQRVERCMIICPEW
jgi:hypothetical protein